MRTREINYNESQNLKVQSAKIIRAREGASRSMVEEQEAPRQLPSVQINKRQQMLEQ